MKRALLSTLVFFFIAFAAQAQYAGQCNGCGTDTEQSNYNSHSNNQDVVTSTPAKKKKISIYPNPAVDFIGLSDIQNVKKITIFNVMGREAKSFTVEKGLKYDVTDLKTGMYLVQVIDFKNKIITTQRLNKR